MMEVDNKSYTWLKTTGSLTTSYEVLDKVQLLIQLLAKYQQEQQEASAGKAD